MWVGFSVARVTELWMPPRLPVISRARRIHDLLLRVVHQDHALIDALGDNGSRRQRTVRVVDLDPVVIDDTGRSRVQFR